MKIFYSWQSDLPNNTNRGLIEKALNNVAKSFNADIESSNRPTIEIDTATKNVTGTVNIADEILKKIDECDIFVGDISIIGILDSHNKGKRKRRRKIPNPNVLFELGYAWKKLSNEKIVTLMNTNYGEFEDLPFDLRGKTIISYSSDKNDEDKANTRAKLEKSINDAISLIIGKDEFQNIANKNKKESPPSIFLQQAQGLAAEKELNAFRNKNLYSQEGLVAGVDSVNKIFSLIDEHHSSNSELFSTLNIEVCKKQYFRSIYDPNFISQIELIGFVEHQQNSLAKMNLKISLFKKRPAYHADRFFTDLIKQYILAADFDFDKTLIWKDTEKRLNSLNSEQVCEKLYKLILEQINKASKSKDTESNEFKW